MGAIKRPSKALKQSKDCVEERIRQKAYFLSQQDPSKSPEANWTQAEDEVLVFGKQKQDRALPGWLWFFVLASLVLALVVIADLIRKNLEATDVYVRNPSMTNFLYYWGIVLLTIFLFKTFCRTPVISNGFSWLADGLIQIGDGKTSWDWIKILGGPTLFGAIAGVVSFMYNQSNQSLSKLLATEKEREQIMNSFVSDMTSLLSRKKWIGLTHDSRLAISTRTLNTLESLQHDGPRQGIAFRFASRVFPDFICLNSEYQEDEPKQYKIMHEQDPNCKWPSNISLQKVQLQSFDIVESNDFYRGTFRFADLRWANLSDSDLQRADLEGADLSNANLAKSRFSPLTNLVEANFHGADINGALFDGTDVRQAKVVETNVIRQLMGWVLSKIGVDPDIIEKNKILLFLAGNENKRNSLLEARFKRITFTRNPEYVNQTKDLLPKEWDKPGPGSTERSSVCTLIEQGRVSFDGGAYQLIKNQNADSDSKDHPKGIPLEPSPYSTPLGPSDLISDTDKKTFDRKFYLKYNCAPSNPMQDIISATSQDE